MADLEHPLLAGSASEEAPTAEGVQEPPAATDSWWQRLFKAAPTDEPPPEDASAWLHAHEVAHRPGGPAAAAVANLSNTSASESSTGKVTAPPLLCALTHLGCLLCRSHWRGHHGPPQGVQSPRHLARQRAVVHCVRPYPPVHQPPPPVRALEHHYTCVLLFLTRGALHPPARRSLAAACPSGRSLRHLWASRGC